MQDNEFDQIAFHKLIQNMSDHTDTGYNSTYLSGRVIGPLQPSDASIIYDALCAAYEEIRRQKIRVIKWRKIARSFAEAGTHPTAHDIALEEYAAFYKSDKF